jgi:hypothetical protein
VELLDLEDEVHVLGRGLHTGLAVDQGRGQGQHPDEEEHGNGPSIRSADTQDEREQHRGESDIPERADLRQEPVEAGVRITMGESCRQTGRSPHDRESEGGQRAQDLLAQRGRFHRSGQ